MNHDEVEKHTVLIILTTQHKIMGAMKCYYTSSYSMECYESFVLIIKFTYTLYNYYQKLSPTTTAILIYNLAVCSALTITGSNILDEFIISSIPNDIVSNENESFNVSLQENI